ncbi:uncharacterized protein LOC100569446 isoform X2 [Acyrthosiphon pisum]|uniref:Uncharacterized protein n=1 Tax=Acyrthosiphon pisum TaxID=7029 RepID=A0A8R1W531_ACYPI|nr:uncharacterized protein LOC100569446 isoform X2 [Acyrthosiphon pisum]|eukprot:XP_003243967.1 PREDICTED: uncharacterized protein LOC100569446 [Acyrthosiphon pisum]
MECRRTVVTGGVLRSPPSVSAAPLTIAANSNVMRHRGRRHSRPYDCADDIVDEYNNNNNNSNVTTVTTINNTTHLIDELEQLRTDNFQLRLRVYNAERRVDRLSAAALARDRKKRSDYTDTDSDDSDASSGADHNNAAAKATAEAAVRTIHDLLTVNRRLLALLAATVSAKAVSVSTDDKRRWQRLRNHIEEYAVDDQHEEKTNEDENDEFHDASATDSETSCKARVLSAERSVTRQNVLRSPPPPPQPPPSTQLETAGVQDDEGAGSEVSRLRGRCRRLERSLQQLVNTELWARNRQIGKLEQQRYVTQVAAQRDRRPAEQAVTAAVAAPPQQQHLQQFPSKAAVSTTSPPATKGILVIRSAAETPCAAKLPAAARTESQTAAASSPPKIATITTPPPVLPDYSEVNFFFSCDEEDDDDDDDHDRRENSTETKSSSEEETVDSNDCKGDEEPVRLAAVGAPLASSTSTRKRHCRPHHRLMQQPIKGVGDSATVTTTTSSSTESAAAEEEADELNGDGVIRTTTTNATSPCTTRRHRTVSGGGGLHRRRRCRPPRRCSTCGRCSGGVDAAVATADRPKPPSVADAQVQCGDGNVAIDHGFNSDRGDGELQLQQLRRELDARRRENGRLYDMLLRLQRGTRPGDRGKGDGGPRIPSPDFSDSDPCGSPEPYRRAAGVVRGRIADLLPPLLSMRSISDDDDDDDGGGGDRSHQRYRPDGAEQQQQQQQQQLQLLTRLRERIVAYERRELNGGDDRAAAVVQQSADPSDDAVRRMDRTELVNVALPRVVERLRRALVPLLQHRPENAVAAASVRGGSGNGGGDFVTDGARSLPPSGGR